ncbi:nucleolar and spindle associated protein 1 (predicted), isoform CRA_b [Rattus norvegicus]|uniref:Nucleolar and spindle associated protein 1 (Predicted), isoform CRA_b n=1 Tax=Rattus norvegicus TaxID=10116 RepID=A6HPG7_RAT|nr:nucleolar and spindle associated protein 1 (predicted), isoform CRA_b [Rattus norvegicus]
MTVPSAEELDSFKYSDLQNLAKRLGLRANLRADKLLRALKAHLNPETRRENKNQDHMEMKRRDSTTFQNQENQDLRATEKVPSLPEQRPEDGNAASSEEGKINDKKGPLEKRSLCTDGFSKLGNSKRISATTPNFKRLHEAHFKKMESIDEYMVRKKKHFKEHDSLNELKLDKKVTPVPPRGRLSVLCTPARQRCSQGHSATKMNVRFSAATKDNEHKCSLTKTPARKSPHVTAPGSASKGQAVLKTPKLKTTERNSTAGKLKPWGQAKENNSLNECVSRVTLHRKTYKQPPLQTREEQRKRHVQERKERKEKLLEARRNLGVTKAQ